MKPYSLDLRTRIVRALQEEGTAKSAAARLFGVSLSSVKRYARIASRGESLKPGKGGGRPPKTDETLFCACSRGWASAKKTDSCGGGGARRVAKSRLEGDACLENRPRAARLRGRDGHEHLALGAARLVAARTKGLLLGASQSGSEYHAALEHDDGGHGGPSLQRWRARLLARSSKLMSSGLCAPCCALGRSW